MAQASTFVARLREDVTKLLNDIDALNGKVAQYNALGGETFIDEHFMIEGENEEPVERTDLDIAKADLMNGLSSVAAINSLLGAGHATNLNKLRQ